LYDRFPAPARVVSDGCSASSTFETEEADEKIEAIDRVESPDALHESPLR
jgi:hypothetical protein